MSTRGATYVFSLSLLAAVLAVTLVGCGGGGGGGGNNDPVINSLSAAAQAVWPSGSTQVTVSASDPDGGNALTYVWTANGGSVSGSGASVLFTAPAAGGQYRVNVTVQDGQGGQASRNITITVGATVRGTVVDVADDQPEAGLQVTVNGLSDTTDNQGAFEIIGISQGTHALTLGGDWVVSGTGVNVTANTPGQVINLPNPVRAVDIGGGPPPPPF